MSATKDQYWACAACDSGGHPLDAERAVEGARLHLERAGHLTVWGTINKGDRA